jgi:pilus assembly protein CpaC
MKPFTIKRTAGWFVALAVIAAASYPPEARAQVRAQSAVAVELQSGKHGGEFLVPINKSQILRVDVPFTDLLVGNEEIADVLPLTNRTIYVLGKSLGSTSLSIYGPGKRLIAIVDLMVTYDIQGLKTRLFDLFPEEEIEVRGVNDSVILSGAVSSSAKLTQALAVSDRYAPGRVTNLLSVNGSQQVLLAVRFVEVKRTVLKEFGLNTKLLFDTGDSLAVGVGSGPNATATATAIPEPLGRVADVSITSTAATGFLAGAVALATGNFALTLDLDALEKKGLLKTLAEPNLIALSGDTASFLAGGEFPVPVAQDTEAGVATITVEFKPFGVSLSFTPTVIGKDLINLVVSPEVSAIDLTTSVEVSGFNIPGLTTRRATTTVELRDGQSFAIAGLIQSDFTDTVNQIPGLGDVPIIGALARSSEFNREETELVIIVTPYLVKPAPAGALITPADNFVPPSDTDIFMYGRVEASVSGVTPKPSGQILSARSGGGIDGKYGYILK